MTGRSTPTNRRHSPSKARTKTLSGSSSNPPVLDLKEVIDSARINFRNEMKRSKSTMASPSSASASTANKSAASGSKSSSAPASPVKAAHIDSTTACTASSNGSKRRAQQPPSLCLMSPKRAKTASVVSDRSKADAATAATASSSSEKSSSSSTSQSIRSTTPSPVVKAAAPSNSSASSARGGPLIVAQPKSRPSLLTEAKRRKAAPMDEVMKLHMDEGVYHLLHSLPTSRRKTQTTLFNSAAPAKSSSPGELGAMKPNSHARGHSPAPVQSQSGGIGGSQKMSAYQRRQHQQAKPPKNNLIRVNSAGVKATTPESLMTPKTLEMLKKLPKKDYVDLWSSKSRYKLAGDVLTAAAACSPPLSNSNLTSTAKASSVSPDSSASSDISSASALAAAAKKRQRIGDRMLTCVTHVNKQYKDILIRSYPTFSQIIMCPSTTGLKHSMNVNVFDEITDAMKTLREDETCKAVLLTGLGGVFCQGIDLSVLTFDSTEKQKKSAESLAGAIKLFVKFLLSYPKLLVAALNGTCAGIGVTLLPYFDVVYASDKATLRADYPRLGQIPEAFASVTMANSPSALRELMLLGRTMTASEAGSYGLVSTPTFWPDKLLEEIVPRMELLETVTTSGLQMTKAVLKDRMRKNVLEVAEEETKMLVAGWSANAKNIRQYLKENCGPNQLLFQ